MHFHIFHYQTLRLPQGPKDPANRLEHASSPGSPSFHGTWFVGLSVVPVSPNPLEGGTCQEAAAEAAMEAAQGRAGPDDDKVHPPLPSRQHALAANRTCPRSWTEDSDSTSHSQAIHKLMCLMSKALNEVTVSSELAVNEAFPCLNDPTSACFHVCNSLLDTRTQASCTMVKVFFSKVLEEGEHQSGASMGARKESW